MLIAPIMNLEGTKEGAGSAIAQAATLKHGIARRTAYGVVVQVFFFLLHMTTMMIITMMTIRSA